MGVNVYYSLPGYKVHSKMAIVRRLEKGTPKIYAYCSTGNFHENTAKLYSDVGILPPIHELLPKQPVFSPSLKLRNP